MSRSGYTDEWEGTPWDEIRAAGAREAAFTGKRGMAFLQEMAAALDAMPEKRLAGGEWIDPESGDACALGLMARVRGVEEAFAKLDPGDDSAAEAAANLLGIAETMARHIVWQNDDYFWGSQITPEVRWTRMRQWVDEQIAYGERKAARKAAKRAAA